MGNWFSVAMAKGGDAVARISIHDEIGGWGVSAKDFMAELSGLGDGVETIELSIHSPGGSVLDGWAIYNALKAHKAEVHVKIEGLAASMATVVAMAGDTVEMPANAFFMIHNPWSVVAGDSGEMREAADFLDKLGAGITSAYAAKTGMSEDEVKHLMDNETWLDGQEASEMGFVDFVSDAKEAAALGITEEVKSLAERLGVPPLMTRAEVIDEPVAEEAAELEELADGLDDLVADAPVIEAEAEVVTEEVDADDEVEVETEPVARLGFLDRMLDKFSSAPGAKVGDDLARLQRSEAELKAQLADQDAQVAKLSSERDALAARVQSMEAEQKQVEALVVERLALCGFSSEEADEVLPAPISHEEVGASAADAPRVQPARAGNKGDHYGVAEVKVKNSNK